MADSDPREGQRDGGERIRDALRRDMRQHINERIERREERWRARREYRRGRPSGFGGVLGGVILAGIGVLFLLQNLGILYVDDIWQYWPVILIVLGLSRAISSFGFGGRLWGGLMAVAGTVFLLHNFNLIHGNVWNYFWPMILIFAGIGMLIRHLDGQHSWSGVVGPPISNDASTTSRLNVSLIFSGLERRIESQDFEGGELNVVFGGIDIDLTKAVTKKDQIVIEANAVFGGINLRVPESWDVTVRGTGVFGGYEDKTVPNRSGDGVKRPHLTVTGGAVFGGVTVRH